MKVLCSHCSYGMVEVPEVELSDRMWSVCPECGAIYIWYVPQEYQETFHKDNHMIKGLFGGFGSGKTTSATAELLDHAFRTSNGRAVVIAPTVKQLEQTVKKEFFKQCPQPLIEAYKVKDNEVVLTNGFSILFYTSDDPVKIRSLDLTIFYIEEASGVSQEIYDVCKTRLRNPHACTFSRNEQGELIKDKDGKPIVIDSWYQGIVCSNPDINWIRSNVLLMSEKIYCDEAQRYVVKEPDKYMSSHIIKTAQNMYLHPDYIPMQKANKPQWWIDRYLEGSFEYSEGMVYPMFAKHICEPFPVPPRWLRISATDFGGRAPHATLMLAIDPDTNIVYAYEEYYQTGLSVAQHQKAIHALIDKVPVGGWYYPLLADPAGKRRATEADKSLFEHYAEYGIYFQPANNVIIEGITKVYTYFDMDKLFIFSSCVHTVNEGMNFRYPDVSLDKNPTEKPMDKDDHAMDCLRYAISILPDNPNQINQIAGIYIVNQGEAKLVKKTSRISPWNNDEEVPYGNWY